MILEGNIHFDQPDISPDDLTVLLIIITRRLQLQATVKRFQFDIYLNLQGQHTLISLLF